MDGIAHVARQQQSQVSPHEIQGGMGVTNSQNSHVSNKTEQNTQSVAQKQTNLVKEMQNSTLDSKQKINSEEEVKELAKKLNEALSPFNTSIKFGVDRDDVFYVAAIDNKTHRVIRRFPAEQAQALLPKMQEVKGLLFDSKG